MASSVSGSCAVWNCQVKASRKFFGDDIQTVGHLGDIGHLRSVIPDSEERTDLDTEYNVTAVTVPIRWEMAVIKMSRDGVWTLCHCVQSAV